MIFPFVKIITLLIHKVKTDFRVYGNGGRPCASFFSGRQQRNCLSRFSVHFFRLEVSKQNEKVCHKLRSSSSGIHAASD